MKVRIKKRLYRLRRILWWNPIFPGWRIEAPDRMNIEDACAEFKKYRHAWGQNCVVVLEDGTEIPSEMFR